MAKEYLGDGVYAQIENGMIDLSAENHDQMNHVFLEPEVMKALVQFAKRHGVQ